MSRSATVVIVLTAVLLITSTVAPVTALAAGAQPDPGGSGGSVAPADPAESAATSAPPETSERWFAADWEALASEFGDATSGASSADSHSDRPTADPSAMGYGAPGKVGLSESGSLGEAPPLPTEGPPERRRRAGGKRPAGEITLDRQKDGGHGGSSMQSSVKRNGLKGVVAPPSVPNATGSGNPCPADAPQRNFTVHAVKVDIVYNKYGQHDPKGVTYVLEENRDEMLRKVRNAPNASIENPNPNATVEEVQPLTIRAQRGECVNIEFVNELNHTASIHPTGVSYGVNGSDGQAVGYNKESTADPHSTVNYTWYAAKKGVYSFADGSSPVAADDDGTLKQNGLFGALVVEPQDAVWRDPQTGNRTRSGVEAMVENPNGDDFREFLVFYHDGAFIRNSDGTIPTWPNSSRVQELYTINYRGDPSGARLEERNESTCPACDKKELFYSSWVHGDPGGGDLVFQSYVGDPIKYRVVGGPAEEKHVHHHHGHRWKSEPKDPSSNTIDSQTVSSGAAYTQEFVAGFGDRSARPGMDYDDAFAAGGAGYAQGSPGDYIFHCHLFPHYASGMWAVLRVHDKDTRAMPNRTDLQPLPDRSAPPKPKTDDPGYPNFIPAKKGERPPQPPTEREPTDLELSALNGSGKSDPMVPGAPYKNPCPNTAETIQYNITVLQTNITYNNFGEYDPKARVYVLSKNADAVLNGSKRPRPLAIRANVGQCVEFNLTNRLPADAEPNEMSMHVHFVGYDVLGSDGLTLGYNYDEGAEPVGDDDRRVVNPRNGSAYKVNSSGSVSYRWYADERGTIFWHDHLSGISKGMHGSFGALLVEPKGSTWLSPSANETIRAGTKARIKNPQGDNFREFVLFYSDYTRLYTPDGDPINGPFGRNMDDQGVMSINYANAPLYRRTDGDSAYTFSSWKHGDPMTPTLEAYPRDPVKVRLIQGGFEESHNFMLSGADWYKESRDSKSPITSAQTIGASEQFRVAISAPRVNPSVDAENVTENPAGIPMTDYLYGSMPIDDLWTGMWGIFRVWRDEVDHLEPLPGNSPPDGYVNQSELAKLKKTGSPPPKRPTAGYPCPKNATVQQYDVVAFTANLTYNEFGDHDPYGVVFATKQNYEAFKNGTRKTLEPLVLRAEEEECVEVNLINRLPANMSQHEDHALVPVDQAADNSNRTSLHPSMLEYNALMSDGTTVGYNWDQTVGPGNNITYRWYADDKVGTTVLWDMADVRSHRHHGAYGVLVVEPQNSTWLDPETGDRIRTGTRAMIQTNQTGSPDFREYVLQFSDGMYVINNDGSCVVPPGEHGGAGVPCNQAAGEPETQGFKGINYRAEPLTRRLNDDSREHLVYSSYVHGDPATPVLNAYIGDPVKLRYAQTADKPHGITFHLAGHVWPRHSTEPKTQFEGASGDHTPGSTSEIVPTYQAGGFQGQAGDYYYGAMKSHGFIEGGLWGIFRVHGSPAGVKPLPDRMPGAPTGVNATDATQPRSLNVSWNVHPNEAVVGYNLYRSNQSGGPYTKVNDKLIGHDEPFHHDDDDLKNNTTYYYVVTAVTASGFESPRSNEANATVAP